MYFQVLIIFRLGTPKLVHTPKYLCNVTHMVLKATEEKRKTRRPGVLTWA